MTSTAPATAIGRGRSRASGWPSIRHGGASVTGREGGELQKGPKDARRARLAGVCQALQGGAQSGPGLPKCCPPRVPLSARPPGSQSHRHPAFKASFSCSLLQARLCQNSSRVCSGLVGAPAITPHTFAQHGDGNRCRPALRRRGTDDVCALHLPGFVGRFSVPDRTMPAPPCHCSWQPEGGWHPHQTHPRSRGPHRHGAGWGARVHALHAAPASCFDGAWSRSRGMAGWTPRRGGGTMSEPGLPGGAGP